MKCISFDLYASDVWGESNNKNLYPKKKYLFTRCEDIEKKLARRILLCKGPNYYFYLASANVFQLTGYSGRVYMLQQSE